MYILYWMDYDLLYAWFVINMRIWVKNMTDNQNVIYLFY